MADVSYERPLYEPKPLVRPREIQYERPVRPPEASAGKGTSDYLTEGALAAGAGAGIGAGAWVLRGMLRGMFPGFPLTKDVAALKRLHNAIVSDDAASGLKNEYEGYKRMAANADRPITFFDYLASRDLPTAKGVMKEFAKYTNNKPEVAALLGDRIGDAQKQRILKSMAEGMGVEQRDLVSGLEELKKSRSENAQPLYDLAFQDKRPIQDARLLSLFGEDTPNMAMMNALKARMKTLGLAGREPPSLYAAEPARRDAWKRLMTTDIPEHMFTGDDWKQLRGYYAPAIEDLHAMRGNLWDHYSAAKRAGNNEDARAYLDSWKKLTDYLDTSTSGAYRSARQQYRGDSDLMAAHELGGELLKKKPAEVRAAIAKMGPDERQALAQGFYGGMDSLDTQRFIREFAARPERYDQRNEILGAVFPDKRKLRSFMDQMKAEYAMQDSSALMGNPAPSADSQPRYPYLRATEGVGGLKMGAIERLGDLLGWPSRRGSRAAMDFGMREAFPVPDPAGGGGQNWMLPDSQRVAGTPLSPLEKLRGAGRFTGVGGLGGLGAYGAQQATGWQPSWLGQDRP